MVMIIMMISHMPVVSADFTETISILIGEIHFTMVSEVLSVSISAMVMECHIMATMILSIPGMVMVSMITTLHTATTLHIATTLRTACTTMVTVGSGVVTMVVGLAIPLIMLMTMAVRLHTEGANGQVLFLQAGITPLVFQATQG